jgi:Fe-S-cluster containining protein
MGDVRRIDELRQVCTGCGGSCLGVRVRLFPDEEVRMRTFAAELGIDDPVVEGRLRTVDGGCVFLDGPRCGIHTRWGSAAKPAICSQYPVILLDTGTERRLGTDPGCYSAFATRAAPPLSGENALPTTVSLDAGAERAEAATLAVLERSTTLDGALGGFLGPGADGFADRWRGLVSAAGLERMLARPETGAAVRTALGPVIAADPRAVELSAEQHAWAVEVARRMVALRLASTVPYVPAVALLALGGALSCAWSDPTPGVFEPALAAWVRAIRAPIWWGAILPDPPALGRLFGRP